MAPSSPPPLSLPPAQHMACHGPVPLFAPRPPRPAQRVTCLVQERHASQEVQPEASIQHVVLGHQRPIIHLSLQVAMLDHHAQLEAEQQVGGVDRPWEKRAGGERGPRLK